MREFKVETNEYVKVHAEATADNFYITMRRTWWSWISKNIRNLITLRFKYVPLYIMRNLEGYSMDDMEVIVVDSKTSILRFDKCCKRPEG